MRPRPRPRRGAAAAVLRVRGPALQRGGLAGLQHGPGRRKPRAARAAARSLAPPRRAGSRIHVGIVEGGRHVRQHADQEVTFSAPQEPGLARLRVTVRQREIACSAEALVTVTDELMPQARAATVHRAGLARLHVRARGRRAWRSRFDPSATSSSSTTGTAISSSHRARKSLKLRYLVRLYVKELVLRNFAGSPPTSCSSAWSSSRCAPKNICEWRQGWHQIS